MAVDTILIRQYSDNIMLLSQQLLAKLRPTVYIKPDCVGEMAFQEQLADSEAREKTGRNQDVVNDDPSYGRRKISPRYFYKAPLVDSMDKVYMAKDPTNEIVQSNAGGLARAQDQVIADAFFATAYGGKEGTTTYALATANKVAVGSTGLTLTKLRAAGKILNAYEVAETERTVACTAAQISDLLGDSTLTSADFNTVKALVDGDVKHFLGFDFVRCEKMAKASTTRKAAAYHRTGMCLGVWLDMKTSIDILPGKHFSAQIYAGQSYGATRLEEKKVVEISCVEA
jgi:hypothetical protein